MQKYCEFKYFSFLVVANVALLGGKAAFGISCMPHKKMCKVGDSILDVVPGGKFTLKKIIPYEKKVIVHTFKCIC